MSRGFVKEEDQEEVPMVPPRADLPEGVTNLVTQVGLDELLAEKQMLVNEKNDLDSLNEKEQRIASNHIKAKLQLLEARIATAKVVNLQEQPQNEIRFSASVKLKIGATGKVQIFQIVGVDEANISKGKIAFTSPLAKALIDKKVGDRAVLKLAKGESVFDILAINY